jgi:hypothetical protein
MKVHVTFDVEIWCNDWQHLDERFPSSFERYVWGRSSHGEFALPKTLEMLARHGLQGVFFVEPLFAARFGLAHLHTIVSMIRDAGQDVQLHLHPEWVDEVRPPLIEACMSKRQHLTHYSLEEQTALIGHGLRLLGEVGVSHVSAFRAGSYACNRNTFKALAANDLRLDSSLNACYEVSAPELFEGVSYLGPRVVDGVETFAVTVFQDGFGRIRPAQITGCSFLELRQAIESAAAAGADEFVIVSHNFEMLRPQGTEPDTIVVRRFERLCAFLGENRKLLPTGKFERRKPVAADHPVMLPQTGPVSTIVRHAEQAWRRLPPWLNPALSAPS